MSYFVNSNTSLFRNYIVEGKDIYELLNSKVESSTKPDSNANSTKPDSNTKSENLQPDSKTVVQNSMGVVNKPVVAAN